jgi:hypothetical protein
VTCVDVFDVSGGECCPTGLDRSVGVLDAGWIESGKRTSNDTGNNACSAKRC